MELKSNRTLTTVAVIDGTKFQANFSPNVEALCGEFLLTLDEAL